MFSVSFENEFCFGFFKHDFAKFPLSELVNYHLCRAVVIGLISFEFESACHCDFFKKRKRIVALSAQIITVDEILRIEFFISSRKSNASSLSSRMSSLIEPIYAR